MGNFNDFAFTLYSFLWEIKMKLFLRLSDAQLWTMLSQTEQE